MTCIVLQPVFTSVLCSLGWLMPMASVVALNLSCRLIRTRLLDTYKACWGNTLLAGAGCQLLGRCHTHANLSPQLLHLRLSSAAGIRSHSGLSSPSLWHLFVITQQIVLEPHLPDTQVCTGLFSICFFLVHLYYVGIHLVLVVEVNEATS